MIILDTNVVSEPLKLQPDPKVLPWLDAQAPETLYLTAINLAELATGIALLPTGRKRTALQLALDQRIMPLFEGRILHFDSKAANAFATLSAELKTSGSTMSFADCAIAAIAVAQGFALATRNTRDFKNTGVVLIDPWGWKFA
jgi:predicted nucleic acid-binding protein